MSNGSKKPGGSLGGDEEAATSSSLDHALLESIFYSEMMLMDDSTSLISNNLLSTLAADGSVRQPPVDTIQETTTTTPLESTSVPQMQHQKHSHETSTSNPPAAVEGGTHATPAPQMESNTEPTGPNMSALSHTQHIDAMPQSQAPDQPLAHYHQQQNPHDAKDGQQATTSLTPPDLSKAPPVVAASVATATATSRIAESDGEKRQKLVSQFATLASRLGIQLPETVVDSLSSQSPVAGTSNAIVATASHSEPAPTPQTSSPTQQRSSDALLSQPNNNPTNPEVRQLAEVANAAVEAASRKRDLDASLNSGSDGGGPSNTGSNAKQAPYSKRRKKPRLSDCEAKLAELQAENSMLKRHLANLSSQSHRLDEERRTQEQRMHSMLEQGAAEDELDTEVKHFQEVYSDYGRRRHQEIHFHLDQLQRLANPTNFTKLGLWTMGQQSSNSRNPIAGILQKELNISAQQGKKILEQRKRIQEVCSNLKECLALLANLKKICVEKTQIFHDRLTKCREILTPRQVVKLIIWINQNTEVLDSVCPGWGSENISSKTPVVKRK